MRTSISVDEIDQGGWRKWQRYFKILWHTISRLASFQPSLTYLTLTDGGVGFYKDVAIALAVKVFGEKISFYFHNKGINARQEYWFDNALYKIVFKNVKVILLSKSLYYAIKKYVPKEHVYFCSNGIPENSSTKTRKKSNIGKVQILFLSNLITTKDVMVLLEACQLLLLKQLPFYCTFIGGEGDITAKQF